MNGRTAGVCDKEKNDRMNRLAECLAVHVVGGENAATYTTTTVRPQRHSILNDAQMRSDNPCAVRHGQISHARAESDTNRLCGLSAAIPFCEDGESRVQCLVVIGSQRDLNPEQICLATEFTWHGTPVCYGLSWSGRAFGWVFS